MKFLPSMAAGWAAEMLAALDAAATAGKVDFYTAPVPASPAVAITTQTKLGTTGLSDPSGSITGTTLTFNTISDDISADDDGTCAFVRFCDGDGNAVLDLTVSTIGGGADLEANSVEFATGGVIKFPTFAMTF